MRIAGKSARVILCSSRDDISDSTMFVRKEGVYQCWARVESFIPIAASFGGYFNTDSPTHNIWITYRPDIVITSSGWVYHVYNKSQPQWLKIIALTRMDLVLKLSCRLTEASDNMIEPAGLSNSGIVPVKQEINF